MQLMCAPALPLVCPWPCFISEPSAGKPLGRKARLRASHGRRAPSYADPRSAWSDYSNTRMPEMPVVYQRLADRVV